ncbi:FtsB family cell division protein [Candidatus Avoscillospira sp. LCP25S3_F1]|uniref:FtsB family cell division protein n=1 Tax=Candidatus Avoscillospira sp. LCP25S3_F1 TaxID=3438825 RepID=UPI003F92A607
MKLKKTPLMAKLLIVVILAALTWKYADLRTDVAAKTSEVAALNQELSTARQENQRLQDNIANMGTDEGVEEIARTKLGLAFPGEITYRDSGK